jgi:hypothetical protein
MKRKCFVILGETGETSASKNIRLKERQGVKLFFPNLTFLAILSFYRMNHFCTL